MRVDDVAGNIWRALRCGTEGIGRGRGRWETRV